MSITNTQYIVTGAAGFIGSAVVWGLNRRGIDDILIVDHLGESEKWKNLRALRYADYMEKDDFFRELADRPPMCCHDVPGFEIPEQDAAYRFGKRNYFFGFGAYG